MALCTNHPNVETAQACQRCRLPFCEACLAEIMGGLYCGPCKEATVRALQAGQRGREKNPQAVAALVLSGLGVSICQLGIVVPLIMCAIGLFLGLSALARSRQRWPGERYDLEWAAVLVSAAGVALWVVGLGLFFLVWVQA